MSYSKKRIVKKSTKGKENVHVGEHIASLKEAYVLQTNTRKLKECNDEIAEFRLVEMKKVVDDVEAIKSNAYQEGLEQAKQEAILELRSETETTMRVEWEDKFAQADQLYNEANDYIRSEKESLDNRLETWVRENEDDLVDVVMESVKALLKKESLHTDPEQVMALVRESLQEVRDKSATVWVRVHPHIKRKINLQNWSERNIEWIADPKLEMADVLVETESEWIDSTMHNKIENLKDIIEEWVVDNDVIR